MLRACHRVFPAGVTRVILEHLVGLHLSEHMHRALQVELAPDHWPLMALALANGGHADALVPFGAEIAAAVRFLAAGADGFMSNRASLDDRARCAPEVSHALRAVMARLLLEAKYAAGRTMMTEWQRAVRACKA